MRGRSARLAGDSEHLVQNGPLAAALLRMDKEAELRKAAVIALPVLAR